MNVTKVVPIPQSSLRREKTYGLHQTSTTAPSLRDDTGKGQIWQLELLKSEGLVRDLNTDWEGFHEHRAVIRVATDQMGNLCIQVQHTPVWIHEKSVYSFQDKITDISLICPGVFRAIETHVNHIATNKTVFES